MFSTKLLAILFLFYGANCKKGDALVDYNLKDIIRHEEIFTNTVKEDLKTIGEEFDKFVEELNTEMEAMREYVKETIKEIQGHAKANMESSDAVLQKNIEDLEVAINSTFSAMNMTMMENLETLSNKTGDERKMLIDWVPECDIPVPAIPVPGNSSIFLMVSEPKSKKFGTENSLGTGLEKIWYRKKYWNQS